MPHCVYTHEHPICQTVGIPIPSLYKDHQVCDIQTLNSPIHIAYPHTSIQSAKSQAFLFSPCRTLRIYEIFQPINSQFHIAYPHTSIQSSTPCPNQPSNPPRHRQTHTIHLPTDAEIRSISHTYTMVFADYSFWDYTRDMI